MFDQHKSLFLKLPRLTKKLFVVMVDIASCFLSVWCSFFLRLGEFDVINNAFSLPVFITCASSVFLALPIFAVSGLYRAIFRYNGISALVILSGSTLLYGICYSMIFTFWGVKGVPKTIGLLQPIILFLLVGGSRVFVRILLGSFLQAVHKKSISKVLIYGAGDAGRQLASGIANSRDMRVLGYLDDDVRLHGHTLNGLVIYDPVNLKEIVVKKDVTDVLLALPSVSRERRNKILHKLAKLNISVRSVPSLSKIASGKVTINEVSELDLDDLLGRESVKPDLFLINHNTKNKTVLVTGAGGSIGSELCRQLLKTRPKRLLLVEVNEYALYQIHQEIQFDSAISQIYQNEGIEVVPLLASVCDEQRMNEIIKTWRPNTVYHAAAYKHVPLVEQNPAEGIRNNVFGTKVCAEVSVRNGVESFVLVSTDKAVRPTNIMGATKRLAEIFLQSLSAANNPFELQSPKIKNSNPIVTKTSFSMVRFGNVLGSSGSVVPLFYEQIKKGGPITLTHKEITRYFMSITEAAQLVIQAGSMGKGGDVFVLDMGQPVRILDLAQRMIELKGLTLKDENNPKGDIEIVVTGLRPGEKLYEELLIANNPEKTLHPRIMKAHEDFVQWEDLQSQLNALNIALCVNNVVQIKSLLKKLVRGYQPSDELVDWVYLEKGRRVKENSNFL